MSDPLVDSYNSYDSSSNGNENNNKYLVVHSKPLCVCIIIVIH